MKKNKLKEYYGTQRPSFAGGPGAGSNFYSGRDLGTHSRGSLGTRGADSNFSRRMQALVPNDYYDLLEEEEEEIDEDVVVENSRYSLEKILLLNESVGDVIDAAKTAAYDFVGDTAAAGISTFLPGASTAWVIKNIYEIKIGRDKADEIVRQFLINPKDEVVESMADILDNLVRDVIDLVQRTVEAIPDPTPAEEAITLSASVLLNLGRVVKVLKTSFGAVKSTSKITRKMALFAIINPLIKYVIELFDSKYIPEKVSENKSIIMGTLQRMVLLGDLIEDYAVQKEVALSVGIPEEQFRYRHRIISSASEIDSYDFESPRNEIPIEQRIEEEQEEYREAMADLSQEREYYEDNLSPDEVRLSDSSSSFFDSPLGRMILKPRGESDPSLRDVYQDLFAESLENKTLAYLVEEKDLKLSEEDEEDVNEMSGAGAAAGFTLPLGASPESDSGQRSSHSGGTAFPYGKKTQRRRKEFARKTFGGK